MRKINRTPEVHKVLCALDNCLACLRFQRWVTGAENDEESIAKSIEGWARLLEKHGFGYLSTEDYAKRLEWMLNNPDQSVPLFSKSKLKRQLARNAMDQATQVGTHAE